MAVLAFALSAQPARCVAASEPADEATRLRLLVAGTIGPLMAAHDVPGLAVGVAIDGRSHVFTFGVASRAEPAPVTDATIFEVGSVSKMFTTTLAALAHVRGDLSLDDHPGRHLPRLRGRPIDRATLWHLGTYTAGGLPLQFPDRVRDDAAALDYLRHWRPDAAPGRVRQYSNPSIGLLGAVTAAAMKDRFAALIEARLLRPLGMPRTYLDVPPTAMADYAWGHRGDAAVRVRPGPMDAAAYGLKTTASDLLRFVQANIDPSGLEPPLRDAIRLTQTGGFALGGMVQGFGWQAYDWPLPLPALLAHGHAPEVIFDPRPVQPVRPLTPTGGTAGVAARLYDKTGSTGGFGSYVAFVPARRIGVVLLANRSVPIPARVEAARAILERLSPAPR